MKSRFSLKFEIRMLDFLRLSFLLLSIRLVSCNNCNENAFCELYGDLMFEPETLPMPKVNNSLTSNNTSDCQLLSDVTDEMPLNLRSMSPWQWVKNVNPNRKPETIIESECLCPHCRGPESYREGGIEYLLTSVPITVPYMVELRQNDGSWQFKKINISVACRCEVSRISN